MSFVLMYAFNFLVVGILKQRRNSSRRSSTAVLLASGSLNYSTRSSRLRGIMPVLVTVVQVKTEYDVGAYFTIHSYVIVFSTRMRLR